MEENLTILRRCSLFAGLSDTQTAALLQSLHPVRRSFSKGEVLLLAGYETQELGVVLCGQIEAEKQTADGVTLTLTRMGPGGIFADILAGSRGAKSPVTGTAATDVTVLLSPYKSLLRPGVPLDAAHAAVLQNRVAAMADKDVALDRRVELLMLHSRREKVVHYLRTEALPAPGGAVRTPDTRAGLAAYLGCERSALCRELSRMRRDGILQIDGRVFRLLPGVPPRQNGRPVRADREENDGMKRCKRCDAAACGDRGEGKRQPGHGGGGPPLRRPAGTALQCVQGADAGGAAHHGGASGALCAGGL